MTSKSFARAVQKKLVENVYEPITFDLTMFEEVPAEDGGEPLENGRGGPLVAEDGQQVIGKIIRQTVLTASKPSDDALLYSLVQSGRSDASMADRGAFIFDFFQNALPGGQYRALMARIKDPNDEVDIAMLTEIYEWLEEEWTDGFPTSGPSESSPRPQNTGKNLTGRSPSKRASTR